MNDLEKYFQNNTGRLIHKWQHYFDIYDRHFSRFRNKEIVLLEIGVSHGGSLQMWRDYFGNGAKIYGIDIDLRCKKFEEENISIFIGSQDDRKFLNYVKTKMPKADIVIDDGGHTMKQQITSFEELFSHVKDDGVYLCEDCHTSYKSSLGGGYRRRSSFIEYSKNWIDQINAFHSRTRRLRVNDFTLHAKSINYYNGIVVVEKGNAEKTFSLMTGNPSWKKVPKKAATHEKILNKARNRLRNICDILRVPFIY